jgi:methylenetetrahydrofolate dehydrogenase (NADP+)/methenyltetrahydrofolate cyclohydrolase
MILDGEAIARAIKEEIKQALHACPGRKPCLAALIVGELPASKIYVEKKVQACLEVGMHSIKRELPDTVSEQELIAEINKLNGNETVDGILVQLPLPPHINPVKILHQIAPEKDVDGLHPLNVGKLYCGEMDAFIPCTPLGIKVLLERSGIEVAGKHALVIGRSNLVGKPMAAILMQQQPGGNATVTVANSRTSNLKELCLSADLVIAAVGKPKLVTEEMVKEGAVVIDVGINKIDNPLKKRGYQLVGDVDFERVKDKCSFITPVPGGIGPMTIAMLLSNTLKSYQARLAAMNQIS